MNSWSATQDRVTGSKAPEPPLIGPGGEIVLLADPNCLTVSLGIESWTCISAAVEYIYVAPASDAAMPHPHRYPDGLLPQRTTAIGCFPWSHLVFMETQPARPW